MRRPWMLAAALLAAIGCEGPEPQREQTLPIDQVPAPALAAAKKALPGYQFEVAFKIKVDGREALELRGRDRRGKTREVEVTPEGEVLEVE